MEQKKPIPEPHPKKFYVADPALPEVGDTVSAQECTGLIPTIPPEPDAVAAYQSLYSTSLPDLSANT